MKLIIAILVLIGSTFAQNTRFVDGTECYCDSIIRTYYYEDSLGIIQSEQPYKNGVNSNGIIYYYQYANLNRDKTKLTRIALYVNNKLIRVEFP